MYPFNIKINDEKLMFVGAGKVATRKICSLLESSSPRITVISPDSTPELASLSAEGRIVWKKRWFLSSDLDEGWRMIFACTSDAAVNKYIGNVATERGILVNIADDGESSTAHMPAVARVDGAVIAVYTGGKEPARAKKLKEQILKLFSN